MISSILNSIHTMFSRKMLFLLGLSAIVSLVLSALLIGGVGFIFKDYLIMPWQWLQSIVNTILVAAGTVGILFVGQILAPLVASLFQDKVISTMEATDYPASKELKDLPLLTEIMQGLKVTMKMLIITCFGLALSLVSGGLSVVIVAIVNSYILGHEFFNMVAVRYNGTDKAQVLFKQHRLIIILGGLLIAGAAAVPLVSFIVPFLGVVLMMHLYHKIVS